MTEVIQLSNYLRNQDELIVFHDMVPIEQERFDAKNGSKK